MTNQTSQTLVVPFSILTSTDFFGTKGWVCDLNPYGDYTALERVCTRENPDEDGTVVWQLTGPPHIKPRRLSALETAEAWGELFLQRAVEKDPPNPRPDLLFGNLRIS